MLVQKDLFTGELIQEPVKAVSRKRKRSNYQQNGTSGCCNNETIKELKEQIASLEQTVLQLRDFICSQQPIKDSYTTVEIAAILGKKPYTVREWCRLKRINAFKAMCGRGCEEEWRVRHEELCRIQNEGLLPVPERY